MIAGDHRAHRVRFAPVNMVKLHEDCIATGLRSTLEQRQERTPVLAVGTWQANRLEQSRQQVHRRDHVPSVDLIRGNRAGPANDQRRTCALHVTVRLGERRGHAVVGQEHHDRVVNPSGLSQFIEDHSNHVVEPPRRGAVAGHLLSDVRQIRQKTGYLHLVRSVFARRGGPLEVTIARHPSTVGSMRIMRAGHQEKRLLRLCRNLKKRTREPAILTGVTAPLVFVAGALPTVHHRPVKNILLPERLAHRAAKITLLAQDRRERWRTRPDSLKAFRTVVMGIQPGEHDAARRSADSDVHIGVLKSHPGGGQAVDVWCDLRCRAAETAGRIPVHVIGDDHQDVRPLDWCPLLRPSRQRLAKRKRHQQQESE